jgi:hypothetical protein
MSRPVLSWIHSRRPTSGLPAQLTLSEGQTLGVSISMRDEEMLLVLLVNPGPLLDQAKGPMVLESITSRGLVRLRGSVERIDTDLVRFAPFGDPELIQRREFVRVLSPQRVTLDDLAGVVVDAHSVNLSGGGMLVSSQPAKIPLDTKLRFNVDLGPQHEPLVGVGRVVRSEDDQLGISFTQISDADRDRLIRFIFDRQRRALAITRGDSI